MEDKLMQVFDALFSDFAVIGKDISTDNCEKWDSLTHLKLIISLKREFSVDFEVAELVNMKSYYVIKNIIEKKTR